jgi:outer membrane protein OmpA-like peptidoglycan-associated protein
MKKSLKLVAACAGLLLLGACADKPVSLPTCPVPPPAPTIVDKQEVGKAYFGFNKSTLKDTKDLQSVVTFAKANPEARFHVVGAADQCGNPDYNYGLGAKRAKAVVDYLVSQGIQRKEFDYTNAKTNVNTVGATLATIACNRKNHAATKNDRIVQVFVEAKVAQ